MECAIRIGRRFLNLKLKRRVDYHRDTFIQAMLESRAVRVIPGGYAPEPGASRVKFTTPRLKTLLELAILIRSKGIVVGPQFDILITKLENHDQ